MEIAFLGDVALFGSNTLNNSQYKNKFEPIKKQLTKYKYIIANLETPLTNCSKTVGGKSAYIKGLPEDIELLKFLGITHVSLANNHMFDYGKKGLDETIETLEKHSIKWYGAYGKVERIYDNDESISLHGYCCYSTNGKGLLGKHKYIDCLIPKKIEQDFDKDVKDGCFPIASCHWGQEHVHYPNYDHIQIAHSIANQYDCIIHGSHPHVIQGIEKYRNSLIAYSLGNFCFSDVYTSKSKKPLIQLSKDNKESIILEVEINNNHILCYKTIAFVFDDKNYTLLDDISGMEKWIEDLKLNKNNYISQRNKKLQNYLLLRKDNRDFTWYMKRLNLESLGILLNRELNKEAYKKTINSYIKKRYGKNE